MEPEMIDSNKKDADQESNEELQKRRDFLKKSGYAAYAAPVMFSLLQSKNAAASNGYLVGSVWHSGNSGNNNCQANQGNGGGLCNDK